MWISSISFISSNYYVIFKMYYIWVILIQEIYLYVVEV